MFYFCTRTTLIIDRLIIDQINFQQREFFCFPATDIYSLEEAFTKFLKSFEHVNSALKAKALTTLTANRFSETTSTQEANSMLAMRSSFLSVVVNYSS